MKSRIEKDLEREITQLRTGITRELDALFAKHGDIPKNRQARERLDKLGREHDKLLEERARVRSDRVRDEGKVLH
ncbi:MAG: hypothetical protein K9L32_00410 [Chromatiaceae bacterium]|nr:hypothetical protein [Chromatiaceae bacterium]MCF8002667.1 hypothetical protein [Chromatiaceae bacterium]